MSTYYNEIEPFAADWIGNLAKAGHVSTGVVDRRSISDVQPADIEGYVRAHFFAGLAGWDHALKLAGWPGDRPVWTGSCPCQPFSVAGRGGGTSDARHLWPELFRLIRACRPRVVFSEQVASPVGLAWFDSVSSDLEGAGYTVWPADLCAAGIGAPHLRQRLYFVAFADGGSRDLHLPQREPRGEVFDAARHGTVGPQPMGDSCRPRSGRHSRGLPGSEGQGERERQEHGCFTHEPLVAGELDSCTGVAQGDAGSSRLARRPSKSGNHGEELTTTERASGATRGFWADAEWIYCRDGKWRPVEPGSFPLVARAPGRMGRLRAYGNAVVPQVAATFVRAFMEATA